MTGDGEPRAALVAVTRPGALRVRGLVPHLPLGAVVVADRLAGLMEGLPNQTLPYRGALSGRIAGLFRDFEQIVLFLSVGAVVRLIAPHLGSKHEDPGVLAVDAGARFVVPVLSGHAGGANAFAERLAVLLGATAVITTASDSLHTIAVDLLGRELGWRLEAPRINVTRVAARLIDGEPIALVQEAGARDWWPGPAALPENVHLFDRLEDVDLGQHSAVLWVTRRAIPAPLWQRLAERLVVYRPPAEGA